MSRSNFLLLFTLFFTLTLQAQNSRTTYSINTDWHFYKGNLAIEEMGDTENWQPVTIPHSWNADDAFETADYYRGMGIYKKQLIFTEADKEKVIVLQFEGANQETEVFVNGKSVGTHIGGYTDFSFPITKFINFGETNDLVVKVDNKFNKDIPTLTADFTFYGGLYRDVYVEKMNKIHFANTKYSTSEVLISTPKVSKESANIQFKGQITNAGSSKQKIEIVQTIKNSDKQTVQEIRKAYSVNPNEDLNFEQEIAAFKSPVLWSPSNPYLYEVVTTIVDAKTNEILDEVANPLGFRWFEFDADKGFYLNGEHLKLIGTCRHQDFKGLGNAVPDALQIEDVKKLHEMGGNFLRICHYPQDPVILETCDRLGIITTVEIPIVNYVTESDAFETNSLEMAKEMVLQDFNHPSIVSWSYMNEILLRPQYEGNPEKQKPYFEFVAALGQKIENEIRDLDPYRYTTLPNHGKYERYVENGITDIPMIVGWNLYQGWYYDDIEGFGDYLDRFHKEIHKPVIVTEYGAGADPRIRSLDKPNRFDFSLEYQVDYHTHYLKEILERDFVAGVNVWNLADFGSATRQDAVQFVNNKGLMTFDRIPKDAYYLYQAFLKTEPFIAIGTKLWNHGSGFTDSATGTTSMQPVSVFSNQKNAVLYHNGVSLGEQTAVDKKLVWYVPFVQGKNLLEVVSETDGKTIKDFHTVDFHLVAKNLDSKEIPFESVLISLGSKHYFLDDLTNEIWLPTQQAEMDGSWGAVGGKIFRMKNQSRQDYGTDQSIKRTRNHPIYQTQNIGLEAFKLPVPDGQYELTLHFAELISDEEKEEIAYNLGADSTAEDTNVERVFDVLVNGKVVLENLDLSKDYGSETAVNFKIKQLVNNNKGITITFNAIKGEPVLNAVELRKIL